MLSSYFLILASMAAYAIGHMQFVTPYHRRSKYSPYYQNAGLVDWNGLDPLGSSAGFTKPYPCKGYQKGPVQATYQIGSTINIEITGTAVHNGGHCQFALSYDDKKFVVIKDVLNRCIVDSLSYSIPIPAGIPPSKNATLAWGWINAMGNREWYMNCVDIELTGGNPNGKLTGPQLLVGNLPGYPLFEEFALGGAHLERFSTRPIISAP